MQEMYFGTKSGTLSYLAPRDALLVRQREYDFISMSYAQLGSVIWKFVYWFTCEMYAL